MSSSGNRGYVASEDDQPAVRAWSELAHAYRDIPNEITKLAAGYHTAPTPQREAVRAKVKGLIRWLDKHDLQMEAALRWRLWSEADTTRLNVLRRKAKQAIADLNVFYIKCPCQQEHYQPEVYLMFGEKLRDFPPRPIPPAGIAALILGEQEASQLDKEHAQTVAAAAAARKKEDDRRGPSPHAPTRARQPPSTSSGPPPFNLRVKLSAPPKKRSSASTKTKERKHKKHRYDTRHTESDRPRTPGRDLDESGDFKRQRLWHDLDAHLDVQDRMQCRPGHLVVGERAREQGRLG